MAYDRKVRYLDYYENGQRLRGCGFLKLELREEDLKLELALRGIEGMDGQQREVMLCSGKREYAIGKISIVRGTAEFRYEGRPRELTGVPDGICIHMDIDREVSGRWQSSVKWQNSAGSMTSKAPFLREELSAAEKSMHGQRPKVWEGEARVEAEERAGGETRSEPAGEMSVEPAGGGGRAVSANPEEVGRGGSSAREEEAGRMPQNRAGAERRESSRQREGAREKAPVRLLEDKWLQICSIYPHIRPFQDEREYLSIGPADFLLFPAESYRQVNNSFLLHGYYNYKHLILTRVERRGEIVYYIGVPGNFYEKEKQVALMFGFESFECADEPAQNGDFGYYMMRTRL